MTEEEIRVAQEAADAEAARLAAEATTKQTGAGGGNVSGAELPAEMPKDDDEEGWSKLPKWLRDLRKENARTRIKLRDTESSLEETRSKLTELEQKDLSEQEKELARLRKMESEALPAQLRRNRELEVQIVAGKLNVVDPEAVVQLLNWTEVEKGEKTVEELVGELIEKKPWLKKVEETTSSSEEKPTDQGTGATKPAITPGGNRTKTGAPANGHQAPPNFSRAAIKKLGDEDPEKLNELYEKGGLKEALAENRLTD